MSRFKQLSYDVSYLMTKTSHRKVLRLSDILYHMQTKGSDFSYRLLDNLYKLEKKKENAGEIRYRITKFRRV